MLGELAKVSSLQVATFLHLRLEAFAYPNLQVSRIHSFATERCAIELLYLHSEKLLELQGRICNSRSNC